MSCSVGKRILLPTRAYISIYICYNLRTTFRDFTFSLPFQLHVYYLEHVEPVSGFLHIVIMSMLDWRLPDNTLH